MCAAWSDEDVRTTRVLAPEPLDRLLDLRGRPRLAEQHATVTSQNADVEVIARHRRELSSDLAIRDDAAHR
jgi:hypothetical protein